MDELSNLTPQHSEFPTEGEQEQAFARAIEAFASGRYQEAREVCLDVLKIVPRHSQALHMLGLVFANEGKVNEGLLYIENALRSDPAHAGLHASHGRILFLAGNYEAAIAALRRALELNPANPEALHCLALCLQRLGNLPAAEQIARQALALQPASSDVLDNLGVILLQRGNRKAAQNCFEQALKHTEHHAGALANLALLHEQDNRPDDALRLVEQGLRHKPDAVTLRLIQGRCMRHQGMPSVAREILERLSTAGTSALRKDVEYELALCADAVGDAEAAYEHMTQANALACSLNPNASRHGEAFIALIERLQQQFTPAWVSSWEKSLRAVQQMPAFLFGFPRSGTTLLDTMLGAHPGLAVLEESPTVQSVLNQLSRQSISYPDALATLADADLRVLEQAYYQAAMRDQQSGKRLLDKSPFNSVHAGLVARLFPGTPILFATRHPCDVILSCYMTNFELNSGTVHFTELAGTVRLYVRMMALWKTYTENLDLNFRLVRYEDLIREPETVLRETVEFLGLPWSPVMLDNVAQAAAREKVRTASYAQIGRPLYRNSENRWRRYRNYLEPHLPALQPYCEMFGYDV